MWKRKVGCRDKSSEAPEIVTEYQLHNIANASKSSPWYKTMMNARIKWITVSRTSMALGGYKNDAARLGHLWSGVPSKVDAF
ncbi:hypothetical protein HBI56_180930 [Parastagonospora nodorum]|nr:hypothetical protein HBH56_186310 [Parastagonospora nodorum]KAH3925428.1 hypothetical protein HBH54_182250 [Parastagonospora nodorum]KAH3940606.1 hypothetical protein HBH53_213780 [Parastagonospora nodorum]KAH3958223.1 hypothetical protein HBH51_212620 [Parastagonospora nodorum]KAH3962197.1 hypothetical protein HBH52_226870 [Parastagonospora nodorum]